MAVSLLLAVAELHADSKWKLQFFYDRDRSALEIRDLQCPSALRCIAAGVIFEKGHPKGTAVVTSDGGEHWSLVELKEQPAALFFLNDSLGWMATNGGIWRTEESGRTWTKLEKLESILALYFLDPMHGYAAGYPKAIYETGDGGKTWRKLPAAEQPSTVKEQTVYDWITFDGPQHGFILGYAGRPRNDRAPDWLDPARAQFRKQAPRTTITLETRDGGKSWQGATAQSLAELTRLKVGQRGSGLGLWEFREFAEFPTEVYRVNLDNYQKTNVYAQSDRVVTDIAYFPDGDAFLATVEHPGKLKDVPIPGKLKILRSSSLSTWLDMDVDYRAVAERAILAGPDAQHLWVATDTGMILKLDNARR